MIAFFVIARHKHGNESCISSNDNSSIVGVKHRMISNKYEIPSRVYEKFFYDAFVEGAKLYHEFIW
jgi:hypothetical protein